MSRDRSLVLRKCMVALVFACECVSMCVPVRVCACVHTRRAEGKEVRELAFIPTNHEKTCGSGSERVQCSVDALCRLGLDHWL